MLVSDERLWKNMSGNARSLAKEFDSRIVAMRYIKMYNCWAKGK
jgi:hypothetical protein